MRKSPFILVDGSSYLYRAFHAMPELTNSKGNPTGAIYGVAKMLKKLQDEYQPSHMAVIFDAKGKTFRNDLYPEYKAHRPPMPDTLRSQIEPLHQLIRSMGYPLLVIEGVEADDVIGTLARQATEQGIDTLISTGDKDMAQLVNPHVTLLDTMNDVKTDEAYVVEKFGVPANRIIDYLALVGDKVDNIPGVNKCGPKTAVKWLTEYDDLQGVMQHADAIKGKIGESLRDALSYLPLSYQLATIKCDVALAQQPDELCVSPIQQSEFVALLQELEFKSWLKAALDGKFNSDTKASTEPASATPEQPQIDRSGYQLLNTTEQLTHWVSALSQVSAFAIDTETTGLDAITAELVGISVAYADNANIQAAYIPLTHQDESQPQLPRQQVLDALAPLLRDPNILKVGQNLKYDVTILAKYLPNAIEPVFDTMLASYVLNSTGSRHDMDTLALKYLGHNTIHFEDIAGKGAKQKTFDQIDIAAAAEYAAEDADITFRLYQVFNDLLAQQPSLQHIFQQIEIPLMPVLAGMEQNGVQINAALLQQQSSELATRIAELTEQAYALAGTEFNLASTKQLQQVLFEQLKLPVLKKTPKGVPSTAEEVLQQLALDYPLPKLLLEHRSLSKLKSTYTDKLPLQINPTTQRVHTSYHQAVTATGRLSSSDPNLQNIPIRTPQGRQIRQAFVASEGYQIVALDYSQIELRIMAHLSDDAGLLQAFNQNLDVHKATAAEVFNVTLDSVTDLQRRSAKAVNFGLIYGMSAFGLAKQLETDRATAQQYIDSYFAKYPGVKTYMENTRVQAAEQGYVETLFGRRLNLPDIQSSNAMRRQAAERTAINAPMQGTAADIIKRAMIAIAQWLPSTPLDVKLLMQVHDELVFEIRTSDLDAAIPQLKQRMEQATTLKVPLIADVGIGDNWDQAH